MILTALDSSPYSAGSTSAFSMGREDRVAERADAIRQGRGVRSEEQLEKKVREVAEDFVSVFMNQVMKSMRSTVQQNPAMHGDNGEKFFQEMLDTEQSKALAKGTGYGLTDLIYESMMASYRVSQPGVAELPGGGQEQQQEEVKPGTVDQMAVAGIE